MKKKGRPKGSVNKTPSLITTNRRVLRNGSSFYICLPRQFVKKHNLKAGDLVPIVANSVLKLIPMGEI